MFGCGAQVGTCINAGRENAKYFESDQHVRHITLLTFSALRVPLPTMRQHYKCKYNTPQPTRRKYLPVSW